MCKINGHSIFTYMAQPWNSKSLSESKKKEQQLAQVQQKAETALQESNKATSESELNQQTAKNVQTKKTNRRDLTSLRVPLSATDTGASTGGSSGIGLNLGG